MWIMERLKKLININIMEDVLVHHFYILWWHITHDQMLKNCLGFWNSCQIKWYFWKMKSWKIG
jgi:hypothetical protein